MSTTLSGFALFALTTVALTAVAGAAWNGAADPASALSIVPHAVEDVSFTFFALPPSPELDGSHYYAVYLAVDASDSAVDVQSAGAVFGPGIEAGLHSYKMHGLFGPKPKATHIRYTVAGAPLFEIELRAAE